MDYTAFATENARAEFQRFVVAFCARCRRAQYHQQLETGEFVCRACYKRNTGYADYLRSIIDPRD